MATQSQSLFQPALVAEATKQAFVKLDPRIMFRNPVMFTVELGTVVMLFVTLAQLLRPDASQGSFGYNFTVFIVLFLTLLFANFAEAIAEARGKAQADSLRNTRQATPAKVRLENGKFETVNSAQLQKGQVFVVEAGEIIPTDGEIIEGLATIDESATTGESAPVIREAGGDKSSVTGGTKVLSDRIVVLVTTAPGESFLDKMIALVEGASRQKTPNEIALTILLAGFTLVFVIVCVTLRLPMVMVPVLSSKSTSMSPAVSTALPLLVMTLARRARSMPAIPMAESSPPMVVGIRHTNRAINEATAMGVLA